MTTAVSCQKRRTRKWHRKPSTRIRIGVPARDVISNRTLNQPPSSRGWGSGFVAKPEVVDPKIDYYSLPQAKNTWGDCCSCEQTDNDSEMMATDQGPKKIVVCSNCKTKMRPVLRD